MDRANLKCYYVRMEASVRNIEKLTDAMFDFVSDFGIRIIMAIVIYIAGRFIVSRIIKGLGKLRGLEKIDVTARSYILNFTKAVLYVALGVSIITLLGVPMTSVIAVIASAGVAIGMAMQGALGNIAGGIMLLIFRPFNVGDYIVAGNEAGYVRSISLVYTVITTFDNRRISIPNGTLMNSTISNNTSENLRRVDINFDIAASEPVSRVEHIIMDVIEASELALEKPAPEVVPASTVTDGLRYAVRVWVRTKQYWDLYNELMREIPTTLAREGVKRPATPVRVEDTEGKRQ